MLESLKGSNVAEAEKKVLKFWKERKIFEESVKSRRNRPIFSFYDGPPFLSGAPHYGHILATAIKDAVTRFFTMAGFRVERRVGWDCHGLPVENLIEKELGLKSKKDIEKTGIAGFNAACRRSVLSSEKIFRETLERVGRFADYRNAYFTMNNGYIESVWWVFKRLWDTGLVYNDFRVTPYCPHCGTPLSNFEVSQGYKETEDPSVFVKFPVSDASFAKKTRNPVYFLVWTTTPWTLPANVALAVGPKIGYVKIEIRNAKTGKKENLILAKDKLSVVGGPHKILEKYKGKDLAGLKYEPPYRVRAEVDESPVAYKVVAADFVSVKEGTGIVHIAPAFGEEDMKLGRLRGLPVILTVDEEGRFNEQVEKWRGVFVKDADPKIADDLRSRGLLFKSERVVHSYPFCWRCDSPLLYYPLDTWYIAIGKIRKKLIENNRKINWRPAHLKEGRFGNGLKEAPDYAFSRNRFWGAPLPLWKCPSCRGIRAIGSFEELASSAVSSGNNYFVLRHGEAESNRNGVISCRLEDKVTLTEEGRRQVRKAARELKRKKIDLIFSSDFPRTGETAEILSRELKVPVHFDWRLREYRLGVFGGRKIEEFYEFIGEEINKFFKAPPGGETLAEVKGRAMDFLLEVERRYRNKNVLIISHGDPLWVLEGAAAGLDNAAIVEARKNYLKVGKWRRIELLNLPYNRDGEADFHRPFVDEVVLKCSECGEVMKRTDEVFDCWFESGAMPYASWHYPFENKKLAEKMFPADFIAEGIDQTRGWFYTLHVLASALTLKDIGLGKDRPAFRNVVANGLILDEFGRKLSKKLRNYTEPDVILEKYGADALRLFLLGSTPIGEDYRFSDGGVEEIHKRVVARLKNVLNFYELYADKKIRSALKSGNELDVWISARLNETIQTVTQKMKSFDLTEAARTLIIFLEDLSNWYVRRSRRRFQKPELSAGGKEDHRAASATLKKSLFETSRLLAPFAPFLAETVFQGLGGWDGKKLSVHLEDWPRAVLTPAGRKILKEMAEVRRLAGLALAAREKAVIKVKQPLLKLEIRGRKMKPRKNLLKILADEINVKEIVFNPKDGTAGGEIELDTEITPALKAEGFVRELTRMVQELRADAGCRIGDKIILNIVLPDGLKKVLEARLGDFKKETGVRELNFKKSVKVDAEAEKRLDGAAVWLGLRKI